MAETLEALSPGEDRFEALRRRTGFWLGPLAAFAVFALAAGLPDPQRRLAAVLALASVYWITEAIPTPVTALLGPALCVALGVAGARQALAPFADPIIFVFVGSFLLARAMEVNRLDRRVALRLLSLPGVASSPALLLAAVGGSAAAVSMWISNTATTAMFLPIVLGVIAVLEPLLTASSPAGARSYATGLLLMTTYAASAAGLATPVGTPPNLIGIGMLESLAGRRITFLEWMLLNLPIVLVMLVVLWLLLARLHPAPVRRLEGVEAALARMRSELGPWTRAQTHTLVAFLFTVALWLLPGALAIALGADDATYKTISRRLDEGVAALLGASLLFLLPLDWPPTRAALSWRDGKKIDWGTILFFAGGLSLGRLAYDTGLAERLARAVLEASGISSLWGITAVAVAFAIALSETTSNTASASMMVPVAIAVAQAAGVSPLPPALGATLGASFGFMLPVSTAPNAIVYGSGRVPLTAMLRAGILFDLAGFVLIWVGLRLLCPLLGFS